MNSSNFLGVCTTRALMKIFEITIKTNIKITLMGWRNSVVFLLENHIVTNQTSAHSGRRVYCETARK